MGASLRWLAEGYSVACGSWIFFRSRPLREKSRLFLITAFSWLSGSRGRSVGPARHYIPDDHWFDTGGLEMSLLYWFCDEIGLHLVEIMAPVGWWRLKRLITLKDRLRGGYSSRHILRVTRRQYCTLNAYTCVNYRWTIQSYICRSWLEEHCLWAAEFFMAYVL